MQPIDVDDFPDEPLTDFHHLFLRSALTILADDTITPTRSPAERRQLEGLCTTGSLMAHQLGDHALAHRLANIARIGE